MVEDSARRELSAFELSRRRRRKRELTRKGITYILLAAFGLSMIIPFLWEVSTSFKDPGEVFKWPPVWIPSQTTYWIEREGKQTEVKFLDATVAVRFKDGPKTGLTEELSSGQVVNLQRWWSPWRKGYAATQERIRRRVDVLGRKTRVRIAETQGGKSELITLPAEKVRKKWELKVVWQNYPKAWHAVPFPRGYINSAFVALIVTAGQVFTSTLAGFAFSRLRFPGRDKLFLGYLATMMIPGVVTMIPIFILLRKMPEGLNSLFNTTFWSSDMELAARYFVGKPIGIDSYFALIAPGLFSAYGTFLLRQFFMSIPTDLEDAAKIDGATLMGIYRHVVLPLSKPALATLTIFTFMGCWNSFMWPLIVTNSMEMKTLPVMLASFQGLYTTEWTLLMAGSIIVMFPILVVFVIGQRWFVEGIKLGAIKG